MSKMGWMITKSTCNIGDDFQCLAARRFIKEIDSLPWIDREEMSYYNGKEVNLIANGWYMHEPSHWPPAKSISPLLTSIHISNTRQKNGKVPRDYMLSKDSIRYLSNHGPVGGRDMFTVEQLRKCGVPAYFSGCLTMTLSSYGSSRGEYVCLVDPTQELETFIRSQTSREIVIIRPEHNSWPKDYSDRLFKAEELLAVYANAHMLITSRLHGALPSLAMGTPVLLLEGKFGDERFEGLKYFVNFATQKDLYNGKYPLDIENPKTNPSEFLVIKKNLERIASAFVEEKMETIDFSEVDRENCEALESARQRTILFYKQNGLESIKKREVQNRARFMARRIQNKFERIKSR